MLKLIATFNRDRDLVVATAGTVQVRLTVDQAEALSYCLNTSGDFSSTGEFLAEVKDTTTQVGVPQTWEILSYRGNGVVLRAVSRDGGIYRHGFRCLLLWDLVTWEADGEVNP